MSNYVQTTFFGPKDSLLSGDPNKVIHGTQVDTELANIATAIASKYDSSSIAGVTIPFGSGAVSGPSITFQSDTTTGFYRAAAETIGIAANGVQVGTIAQTAVTLASGVSLTVGGNTTLNGTLTVSGASTLASASITGNVTAGSLTVSGSASLNDNATVKGPSGSWASLTLTDGQSGNASWQILDGYVNSASPGAFAIYSNTLSFSPFSISTTGNLTVHAPSSGIALLVNGLSGAVAAQIQSASTSGTGDLYVNRTSSTANSVAQGPNIYCSDGTYSSIFQSSGGQTELWQYNTAWRQIARWLSSSSAGGQVMQIPDDGGTMQNVGWRGCPVEGVNGNYTLTLADRGKCKLQFGASGSTITVPANVFSGGDVVTIMAFNSTNTYPIAPGSGLTLYWANGTVTSGSRTLTSVGVCTIVFESATVAMISGSGLS